MFEKEVVSVVMVGGFLVRVVGCFWCGVEVCGFVLRLCVGGLWWSLCFWVGRVDEVICGFF